MVRVESVSQIAEVNTYANAKQISLEALILIIATAEEVANLDAILVVNVVDRRIVGHVICRYVCIRHAYTRECRAKARVKTDRTEGLAGLRIKHLREDPDTINMRLTVPQKTAREL